VKEAQFRGAPVVGCFSDDRGERYTDATLQVPKLGVMEPLVANVYFQLFAYHVADLKSQPIDSSRDLAESVTVE
jgi:glucosamine--fructose-6-phosphate aminotransferase (isomerizing)